MVVCVRSSRFEAFFPLQVRVAWVERVLPGSVLLFQEREAKESVAINYEDTSRNTQFFNKSSNCLS